MNCFEELEKYLGRLSPETEREFEYVQLCFGERVGSSGDDQVVLLLVGLVQQGALLGDGRHKSPKIVRTFSIEELGCLGFKS